LIKAGRGGSHRPVLDPCFAESVRRSRPSFPTTTRCGRGHDRHGAVSITRRAEQSMYNHIPRAPDPIRPARPASVRQGKEEKLQKRGHRMDRKRSLVLISSQFLPCRSPAPPARLRRTPTESAGMRRRGVRRISGCPRHPTRNKLARDLRLIALNTATRSAHRVSNVRQMSPRAPRVNEATPSSIAAPPYELGKTEYVGNAFLHAPANATAIRVHQ